MGRSTTAPTSTAPSTTRPPESVPTETSKLDRFYLDTNFSNYYETPSQNVALDKSCWSQINLAPILSRKSFFCWFGNFFASKASRGILALGNFSSLFLSMQNFHAAFVVDVADAKRQMVRCCPSFKVLKFLQEINVWCLMFFQKSLWPVPSWPR